MKVVVDYKLRVASRYQALTKEQIPTKVIESEKYFSSGKIDGHFAALSIKKGKATFYNRTGKELALPILEKEAEKLLSGKEIILAGELYVKNEKERTRSFHVSEAIAKTGATNLQFAAFDFIEINGENPKLTTEAMVQQLCGLLPNNGVIHSIKTEVFKSRNEVLKLYEEEVENKNGEGLVIRSAEGMIYKIKPRNTFDAVIIGYSVGESDRSNVVRSILTGFMKPDGSYHVASKVGSGFTEEQRMSLYNTLSTMHVGSEFIEVAENQVAFQMIRPEIVVEFSCIDVIPEMYGKAVQKMDLKYDQKDGYKIISPSSSVIFISPVFEGIRADKKVDANEIRFSQLTSITDLLATSSTKESKESTMLRREVYVKETKGEKAIRKFLAWKTNKEQRGDFPAFVFYFTDFSPSRKDMLQQEMKIASTETELLKMFEDSLVENIKKGWNKV